MGEGSIARLGLRKSQELAEARAELDSLRHAESVLLAECARLRGELEERRNALRIGQNALRIGQKSLERALELRESSLAAGRELAEAVEAHKRAIGTKYVVVRDVDLYEALARYREATQEEARDNFTSTVEGAEAYERRRVGD